MRQKSERLRNIERSRVRLIKGERVCRKTEGEIDGNTDKKDRQR